MSLLGSDARPEPGIYMLRAEHATPGRFRVLVVGACREQDWWTGSGMARWKRLYVQCHDWARYERLEAIPPHLGLPRVPASPEALANALLNDPQALAALARLLREPAGASARAILATAFSVEDPNGVV